MRRLRDVRAAARQEGDGDRPGQREGDQDDETGAIAAGRVPEIPDQHRKGRLGDTVGREDDAHQPAEDPDPEELRRHQRNDHVFAAQSDSEDHREGVECRRRVGEEEQRDRSGDQRVDQDHHVLARDAVGQPSHEQPSDDAAGQDGRGDRRGGGLRELHVEAEKQLEVLVGPADGADRAHAAERQKVERRVAEDAAHRRARPLPAWSRVSRRRPRARRARSRRAAAPAG